MTVAIHEGAGTPLESKIKYAQALAAASLLPSTYKNQPANVLLAVELGESLGISSIQAINGIHVIEGKPSASADLIASLVRRAGHKLRISVDDEHLVVVAQIIRSDDPDFTYEARWDMDKAKAAGLAGKGNWAKYPGQMLRNRAITEVCRMGASDALYGVIYTPEELGAETNPEGNVTVQQVNAAPDPEPAGKPPSIQDAITSHKVANTPPSDDGLAAATAMHEGEHIVAGGPAPVEPQGEPLRSPSQAKKLAVVMREAGLDKDRDEAMAYFESVIGRRPASSKELTVSECSKIIDALEMPAADGANPVTGEVVDGEIVDDWPSTAGASHDHAR